MLSERKGSFPAPGTVNFAQVSAWVPWINQEAASRGEELPHCPRPDPPSSATHCTRDTDCEPMEYCSKDEGKCYKRNTGIKQQFLFLCSFFILFADCSDVPMFKTGMLNAVGYTPKYLHAQLSSECPGWKEDFGCDAWPPNWSDCVGALCRRTCGFCHRSRICSWTPGNFAPTVSRREIVTQRNYHKGRTG